MEIETRTVGDRANALLIELSNENDPVGRRDLSGSPTLIFTMTSELGVVKESAGTVTNQQVDGGIFAITGITNAYPGVVTVSAAGSLINGHRGVIESVRGMDEINGAEIEVANLSVNSFDMKDLDTRSWGIYSASSGLFINRGFVSISFDADQVDEAGLFDFQIKRTAGGLDDHYPVLKEFQVRFRESHITIR